MGLILQELSYAGRPTGEQITSAASDWGLWSTEEGHLTLIKKSEEASWSRGYINWVPKLA